MISDCTPTVAMPDSPYNPFRGSCCPGAAIASTFAIEGLVHLNNCTVTGNTGTSGTLFASADAPILLSNTIVAEQESGNDCGGAIISQCHNLDGDGTCNLIADGDIPNGDARLGPLQNNGGPTETHALLLGSDAIDSGNPAPPGSGGLACEALDQRGIARSEGVACDIGAYERQIGDPGDPCTENAQCVSGFCADGVCCDTACDGQCVRCDLSASLGFCTPYPEFTDPENECPICHACDGTGSCQPWAVPEGQDPFDDCPTDPVATCGRTGVCDGNGACALYPVGTICVSQQCLADGRSAIEEAQCDQTAHCVGDTVDCTPFACDPDTLTCHTSCTSHDDCLPDAACLDNGQCVVITDDIPTTSAWGIVILTLLILTGAKLGFSMRRNPTAQANPL